MLFFLTIKVEIPYSLTSVCEHVRMLPHMMRSDFNRPFDR